LAANELLEIQGRDASHGLLNLPLPGVPVHVRVHPAEFHPEGLIIYSASRRYRSAHSAIEAPGPANEWKAAQYRFHPERASALQVITQPGEENAWQGLTIRNAGEDTHLIVIDWLAWEP
jgi:hypothetical protein